MTRAGRRRGNAAELAAAAHRAVEGQGERIHGLVRRREEAADRIDAHERLGVHGVSHGRIRGEQGDDPVDVALREWAAR